MATFGRVHLMPILLFIVLLLHGATLGLTDDEAYYWVLAQTPSLGFAFHPPGVTWSIAAAQCAFGWILPGNSPGIVRLPAAFFASGVLWIALEWIRNVSGKEKVEKAGLVVLSFAGIFGAAWMIVPDLPLIFGWALAFYATWQLCFQPDGSKWKFLALFVGISISILSKYSGILVAISSVLSILIWAPKERKRSAVFLIICSVLIAALPIIFWNANHKWASIVYQIKDRHGSSGISLKRYGRFWASQLLLAGPPLLIFGILIFRRIFQSSATLSRFIFVFFLPPALIFLVQPLWSDFKPHWALIAWLPVAFELAYFFNESKASIFAKSQLAYGLSIGLMGLVFCHFPLTSFIASSFMDKTIDPRMDVTNDMYGWAELHSYIKKERPEFEALPIVGSRYQTSAQAAFAIGDFRKVSFIPRDEKQLDEWPNLGISSEQGPFWPKLLRPTLFIADNRYDAGPSFVDSKCEKIKRLEKKRWSYTAKWIDLWLCLPNNS